MFNFYMKFLTVSMALLFSVGSIQASGSGSLDGLLMDSSVANQNSSLGHTKIAIGPDRRLYMSTDYGIILRIDDEQNVDLVGVVGNFPGTPIPATLFLFTAGITFDSSGNLYVVNGTGIYSFSAKQLKDDVIPLGNMPVLDDMAIYAHATPPFLTGSGVAEVTPDVVVADTVTPNFGFAFPLGLAADPKGNLYMTDMLGGDIYKIDSETGDNVLFADGEDVGYREISVDQLNPTDGPFAQFNGAFGPADMDIDHKGKWLYFGTQEGADSDGNPSAPGVYRLEIRNDGTAGRLQTLVTFPGDDQEFAINGISYDKVQKKIYIASPFRNFQKGTGGVGSGLNGVNFNSPIVPIVSNSEGDDVYDDNDHIQTAGGVWSLKIDKKADKEPAGDVSSFVTLEKVLIDPVDAGQAIDVVSGWKFGKGNGNEWHKKLIVSDGGFDTNNGVWTNALDGQIYSDDRPNHGALRIIKLAD